MEEYAKIFFWFNIIDFVFYFAIAMTKSPTIVIKSRFDCIIHTLGALVLAIIGYVSIWGS